MIPPSKKNRIFSLILDPAARSVLIALAQYGPDSAERIAQTVKLSLRDVNRILKKLLLSGLILEESKSRFRLDDEYVRFILKGDHRS